MLLNLFILFGPGDLFRGAGQARESGRRVVRGGYGVGFGALCLKAERAKLVAFALGDGVARHSGTSESARFRAWLARRRVAGVPRRLSGPSAAG